MVIIWITSRPYPKQIQPTWFTFTHNYQITLNINKTILPFLTQRCFLFSVIAADSFWSWWEFLPLVLNAGIGSLSLNLLSHYLKQSGYETAALCRRDCSSVQIRSSGPGEEDPHRTPRLTPSCNGNFEKLISNSIRGVRKLSRDKTVIKRKGLFQWGFFSQKPQPPSLYSFLAKELLLPGFL